MALDTLKRVPHNQEAQNDFDWLYSKINEGVKDEAPKPDGIVSHQCKKLKEWVEKNIHESSSAEVLGGSE